MRVGKTGWVGLLLAAVFLSVQGCATTGRRPGPGANPAEARVSDPLKPMNQKIFNFNLGLYDYVLEPLAEGYQAVTPVVLRKMIASFFDNAAYPYVFLNDFLQGRTHQGFSDLGRFSVNTVLGVGGLFDVGSLMGLPPHENNLGVTLGVWGIPQGAYLVLPFFGPASVRSLPGIPLQIFTSPFYYVTDTTAQWSIGATGVVNTGYTERDEVRSVKESLFPYYFARSAWVQHEEYLIRGSKLSHRQLLEKFGLPPEKALPATENPEAPATRP